MCNRFIESDVKSAIKNHSHPVPPTENCDEKHATYNTLKIRVQCHAFGI